MQTKICPYCGETVNAIAKKCRFCGDFLDPIWREVSDFKHFGNRAMIVNNNNNSGFLKNDHVVDVIAPILPKYRVVYIILAIFLGWSGIHDFYADRPGMGGVCLLLSVVSLVLFIAGVFPLPIIGLLIMILLEIIFIQKDGHGIPFKSIKSVKGKEK